MRRPVHRERDVRPLDDRVLHAAVEVVAVERDVDDAERQCRAALDLLDVLADALGDVDAARADADERQVGGALVALEDLVRDADERPLDGHRIHHQTAAVVAHRPVQTRKCLRGDAGRHCVRDPLSRPGRL
jgi:hypothetical protein